MSFFLCFSDEFLYRKLGQTFLTVHTLSYALPPSAFAYVLRHSYARISRTIYLASYTTRDLVRVSLARGFGAVSMPIHLRAFLERDIARDMRVRTHLYVSIVTYSVPKSCIEARTRRHYQIPHVHHTVK